VGLSIVWFNLKKQILETNLRQNFQSTSNEGLMAYNRCKQTGMLRKNGNINKSECAFCNKMSHEDPAKQQDNQFFPTSALGANQVHSNEDDYVVFRYKETINHPYADMKMSDLFPAAVDIGNPDAFPPHLYAVWEDEKRLGKLAFDAAYIVPV